MNIPYTRYRFRAMIGTGGIGTGSFFALTGNRTMGREESRAGCFVDRRDYCKLHIVSHYVKELLGEDFSVFPVGAVGADGPGRGLLKEMEEAGLDLERVKMMEDADTLFSFCFVYPDGSGGNMTTQDSASGRISAGDVLEAENLFRRYRGRGIALAVPEVPLAARRQLLELGSRYSFFRAASFTSSEMAEVRESRILQHVDLLALNLEEAGHIAGVEEGEDGREQVRRVLGALGQLYPCLQVSVTAGERGSWVWDTRKLSFQPVVEVEAVSTAGAGDAFLAGMITGITLGLSMEESQQLAALAASLSITSPHTIHKGVSWESLGGLVRKKALSLSDRVGELFA